MKYTFKNKEIIKLAFIAYSIVIAVKYLLIAVIKGNFILDQQQERFTTFTFTDWLINYEGGFVRRGITGEILKWLYDVHNIDIAESIIWITIVTTTALILFTIYFFRKKGLSFFLLPNVILLGSFAMNNITTHKRDALMLLMVFTVLYLYKKWREAKGDNSLYYISMSAAAILVVLTHEASFFCFAPFIMLHYFCSCEGKGFLTKAARTALISLPFIAAMGAVCIFKGNEEVSNTIWNSYAPYFNEKFGEMLPVAGGVGALTWTTAYAADFHLHENYLLPLVGGVPRLFASLLIYFAAFYLMSNANKIKMFKYETADINNSHLATVLAVQFISLLPLFSVLSCDLGRIFTYWSFSSFFIFAYIKEEKLSLFSRLGEKASTLFCNTAVFRKNWFYILVACLIPVPIMGFAIPEALYSSVIGNLVKIFEIATVLL